MAVKKGDKVKVDYIGSYETGEIFDDSKRHGQPLEFVAGTGQVVPGFDNAVIGMKKGEKKTVLIEPKDGYGEQHPELIMKMPREMVPKDKEPQPGMMMVVGTPDGKKFPAMIREVGATELVIDLNHPLAGRKLKFDITLIE